MDYEEDNLLKDLMLQYALQGFEDWQQHTDGEVQRRAGKLLHHRIFSSDGELRYGMSQSNFTKFFPMPKYGYKSEIDFCFFLPRYDNSEGRCTWSFVLFILLTKENSLVFRFEPAEDTGRRHDYAHVQFCQSVKDMDPAPIGVPDVMPERDPAFPLPSSNPVRLFLSMATAVHGRSGGVKAVIRQIFSTAERAPVGKKYEQILNDTLDECVMTESGE